MKVPGLVTSAAEQLFRLGVGCRNQLYRHRLLRVHRLEQPVISVGNLSVGGTGKSPLVAYLCRLLLEMGYAPAVLSRGYRGLAERSNRIVSDGRSILCDVRTSGDEAFMLAQELPDVPLAVGADRVASARMIARQLPHLRRVFVLDDGFQHRRLARTVDLVAVDATIPLAALRLIPAGPLREPAGSLRRADAVLLTRCHQATTRVVEQMTYLQRCAPSLPVFTFKTVFEGYRGLGETTTVPMAGFVGRKAVALAALGNPGQFLHDLGRSGLRVINEFLFPDHHAYTRGEVRLVVQRARRLGAEMLITTAKDAVRLDESDLDGFPCHVLEIRFESEDPTAFRSWLEHRLPAAEAAP